MRSALSFAIVTIVAALATVGKAAQQPASSLLWVGTWAASPAPRVDAPPAQGAAGPAPARTDVPPGVTRVAPGQHLEVGGQSSVHLHGQTLRQIAHLSLGGSRLRVVVTNAFGTVPLTVGAAHVALRDKDAAVVPATIRPLMFSGSARVTVAAGAVAYSDPVDLVVPDFADLAIDLYLPDDTAATHAPLTMHAASWQTNYVSPPGNFSGAPVLPVLTTTAYRRTDGLPSATGFFLARVDVAAPAGTGAVVTLGDSITDGTHSVIDTNSRWPDHLARRLRSAGIRMGVMNAGIGGNRVLNDGNGPNALARLDRDVLVQPGVTHVVVLEGINDIGQGRDQAQPSAADLIAAHRQIIERAHARGLRIYGATLTPFEGAAYWTPAGEAKRQALNAWIRSSMSPGGPPQDGAGGPGGPGGPGTPGTYDAVFDFDAVIRDPAHPTRARPEFDPGDHLHLTPAGYEAVARSIDLQLFKFQPVAASRR